jgi:hypothetical protein
MNRSRLTQRTANCARLLTRRFAITNRAAHRSCDPPRRAGFWTLYGSLPKNIQVLADRAFDRLKTDPHYPSLHFKKAGDFRSVRVGIHHRALAVETDGGVLWFWIGTHAEYDRMTG